LLFKQGERLTLLLIHRQLPKCDKTGNILEKIILVNGMHIVPFHHVQINILCKLSLPTLNVNIVELYQKSSSLKYILGVLNSGLGKVPVR